MEKIRGDQGALIVKAARKAIVDYFRTGTVSIADLPDGLDFECGVFVTLKKHSARGEKLRGCIGYPEPIYRLSRGLSKSSVSAAVSDPRFSPVQETELEGLIVEVTLLSKPEEVSHIDRSQLPSLIDIGKHGLIIEKGIHKGLLLPQVPVEEEWDPEEFLSYCCLKAGLPPDEWLDRGTSVFVFTGRVFRELEPKGEIVEEFLKSKTGKR